MQACLGVCLMGLGGTNFNPLIEALFYAGEPKTERKIKMRHIFQSSN